MKNVQGRVQDLKIFSHPIVLKNYYDDKLVHDPQPEKQNMLRRIFSSHKNPIFAIHKSQNTLSTFFCNGGGTKTEIIDDPNKGV